MEFLRQHMIVGSPDGITLQKGCKVKEECHASVLRISAHGSLNPLDELVHCPSPAQILIIDKVRNYIESKPYLIQRHGACYDIPGYYKYIHTLSQLMITAAEIFFELS